MKILAPLLLLSVLAASALAQTAPQPVHVVVVGTTDVHGWFAGHDDRAPHYGGLPLFASYVEALRAANQGNVILVDSGDLFQGTLESNLFEGEPVVAGYNAIGYNAAAVGNHEFDYGPVGPDSVARTKDQDPLGALKRNAAAAHFPFLAANLVEAASGKTPSWVKPYIVVTTGGAKIGIIGLSTPDTPNVTTPQNVASLRFTDPVQAVRRAASELRSQKVDAIIAIGHMGGKCGDIKNVEDAGSCEKEQEAMRLLTALPPGTIDGYFAGHTHQQMRNIINGVPASQGLAYSREFSTLDLWIDPVAHHVTKSALRPLTMICASVFTGTESCDSHDAPKGTAMVPRTFEGRTIAADAKLAALLQPYLEKVAAKRNEKLGIKTTAPFTREYSKESTLGDLMTDAIRSGTGADIAVVNSGGIRATLKAGDLVYGDVFEVSPFDNYVAVVPLTGAQVLDALQRTSNGERGILQVSGLRYTIDAAKDSGKPAAERQRVVAATLADGKALDRAATYKVAMPDFLSSGGDGLMPIMQHVPKEKVDVLYDHGPLREIMISALQKRGGELSPKVEGRITVLNEKATGTSAPAD